MGEMSQSFIANDDYGVVAGTATVTLDLDLVDRSYGLAVDPEPRAALILDLPMPFNGDRQRFEETLIEDLSEHPFANLTVSILFEVEDALGQTVSRLTSKLFCQAVAFSSPWRVRLSNNAAIFCGRARTPAASSKFYGRFHTDQKISLPPKSRI